jgi:hypothetical protein
VADDILNVEEKKRTGQPGWQAAKRAHLAWIWTAWRPRQVAAALQGSSRHGETVMLVEDPALMLCHWSCWGVVQFIHGHNILAGMQAPAAAGGSGAEGGKGAEGA